MKPKIIVLAPVKNEAWILSTSLVQLNKIADHIILADQSSNDDTTIIAKKYPRVRVIKNKLKGHSNAIRWKLLDEARKIPGNNIILCVDADEIINPQLFMKFLNDNEAKLTPGTCLDFLWVQLWNSPKTYRNDESVWKPSWKQIGFIDDRKLDYDRSKVVINDHTERIPAKNAKRTIRVDNCPLLHLQWAYPQFVQLKQAWYRCQELCAKPKHKLLQSIIVNYKYSITLPDKPKLDATPSEWIKGIKIPKRLEIKNSWQMQEILKLFSQKGIKFFELLQIWHIQQLNDKFVSETHIKPRPEKISSIIIALRRVLKGK